MLNRAYHAYVHQMLSVALYQAFLENVSESKYAAVNLREGYPFK